MDELIQKYLDGTLSDEEAAAFGDALTRDAELDAELRAFERALALAAEGVVREPRAGFTDGVMDRVSTTTEPRAHNRASRMSLWDGLLGRAPVWGRRMAWAAGFAAVFVLGFLVAGQGGFGTGDAPVETALDRSAAASDGSLRLARLIYVPREPDIDRVTVAGTFNGWDPAAHEMRREGDVWVLQLVLPPANYEYMFVENGERWVTDPLSPQTRDDGFGRENAVLDLTL